MNMELFIKSYEGQELLIESKDKKLVGYWLKVNEKLSLADITDLQIESYPFIMERLDTKMCLVLGYNISNNKYYSAMFTNLEDTSSMEICVENCNINDALNTLNNCLMSEEELNSTITIRL